MSKNSQEGDQTQEQQEQELKDFRNEFIRISAEATLRQYEEKNRDRIVSTPSIWPDWSEKWKEVIGSSYFQPQTIVKPPVAVGRNNVERSDPKSRNYRTLITFSEVMWRKIRRRVKKKVKDFYILEGKAAGDSSGKIRPIYQNLSVDRVKQILGEKTLDKIKSEVRESGLDHGSIQDNFDISVEGFWEVSFAPQRDNNDTPDVRLTWEGQCLRMQRQVPVVLPGFYLEVADHTTRPHYTQTPEQGRKIVGYIQEYPYTVTREASMEEYLVMREQGDKIMRDAMKREESNV